LNNDDDDNDNDNEGPLFASRRDSARLTPSLPSSMLAATIDDEEAAECRGWLPSFSGIKSAASGAASRLAKFTAAAARS
jgi:hypothetical protein